MDSIFVSGLRVATVVGVNRWEQQIQQTLVIDLELGVDLVLAGSSDDLQHTIDYWALAQQVKQWLQERHFKLIEAVAAYVADNILQKFPVAFVVVKIAKPSVSSELSQVAVKITRTAHD